MTKWPSGPWQVRINEEATADEICTIYANAVIYISAVDGVDLTEGNKQRSAAAHLIAAAPELYSELEQLVEFFDGYQGKEFINAKAVLAKARGE